MLDKSALASIAEQLMEQKEVVVDGKATPVRRTSRNKLRTARVRIGRKDYEAIEQNPEKPSRWGQLAKAGHKVVQFKDAVSNKFVAVAVDGKVMVYGKKDS